MNNNPFFSIVIPVYNKEKYIQKTLDSVLTQTFEDFEIILVDDGSKDKSYKIIKNIKDSRIHLIRQENGGPSKARNLGIKESKGQFIVFLDADDIWFPNKLEKQYKLHSENPELMWSCSAFKSVYIKEIEKTAKSSKEIINCYHENGVLPDAIEAIIDGLSVWTSTVVIKKDVFFNDRFFFNEDYATSEDKEVWYKLACIFPKIGYIKDATALYNIGTENSLVAKARRNMTMRSLSMSKRIENELNMIETERKKKMLTYIDELNKKHIISFWVDTNMFDYDIEYIKPYIDNSLLKKLKQWQKFPKIIKRIIIKTNILQNFSSIQSNMEA